jgi:hypothetical protein
MGFVFYFIYFSLSQLLFYTFIFHGHDFGFTLFSLGGSLNLSFLHVAQVFGFIIKNLKLLRSTHFTRLVLDKIKCGAQKLHKTRRTQKFSHHNFYIFKISHKISFSYYLQLLHKNIYLFEACNHTYN